MHYNLTLKCDNDKYPLRVFEDNFYNDSVGTLWAGPQHNRHFFLHFTKDLQRPLSAGREEDSGV